MAQPIVNEEGQRIGLTAAFDWSRARTWSVFVGSAVAMGAASVVITLGVMGLVVHTFRVPATALNAQVLIAVMSGILHLFALIAIGMWVPGAPRSDLSAQSRSFVVRSAVSLPKDLPFLVAWSLAAWLAVYGVNALSVYLTGLHAGMLLAFGAVIIVIGIEYPVRYLLNSDS